MTSDMQFKMAQIISSNILTPVIYMLERDGVLDFICFCDRNITMQEIYNVERIIQNETGRCAEIIDIREFSEQERLEVINRATLIHSEHPIIESVFTQSMLEDFRAAMEERQTILTRKRETGTYYAQ